MLATCLFDGGADAAGVDTDRAVSEAFCGAAVVVDALFAGVLVEVPFGSDSGLLLAILTVAHYCRMAESRLLSHTPRLRLC